MRTKNVIGTVIAALALLLVPLFAMQVSSDVVWSVSDFVIAGALLVGAGLAYELFASRSGSFAYRLAAVVAVGTALFLVWANLAVGLIGNENNPANLMFFIVPLVEIAGAVLARFEARGMVHALLATALAQVAVSVVAFVGGMGSAWMVTGFFTMLWLGSALLFWHAGNNERSIRA